MKVTAALVVGLLSAPAWCDTQTVRVVGITDGDTIKVVDMERNQIRIRLASIDSPEHNQAFGARAKKSLSDLVFGADVEITCRKKMSYARRVCVVFRNGNDINLEQLKRGMGWWSRKYAHEQTPEHRVEYDAAERTARTQRIGLWSDPKPIPPWEWRHR